MKGVTGVPIGYNELREVTKSYMGCEGYMGARRVYRHLEGVT